MPKNQHEMSGARWWLKGSDGVDPSGAQPISFCQVGAQSLQREKLDLVLLELLKGSHHMCSGYRLRLSRVLHPPLNQLLYKLLRGVHSEKECQEEADQQACAEGDPKHLVLAQTKALSDPLDVRLVP